MKSNYLIVWRISCVLSICKKICQICQPCDWNPVCPFADAVQRGARRADGESRLSNEGSQWSYKLIRIWVLVNPYVEDILKRTTVFARTTATFTQRRRSNNSNRSARRNSAPRHLRDHLQQQPQQWPGYNNLLLTKTKVSCFTVETNVDLSLLLWTEGKSSVSKILYARIHTPQASLKIPAEAHILQASCMALLAKWRAYRVGWVLQWETRLKRHYSQHY